MLSRAEHLPLMLHIGIGLELRPCLGNLYAVLYAALVYMFHQYSVDAAAPKLWSYSYQEQIERVVLF